MKKIFFILNILLIQIFCDAQIPSGYYDEADGKIQQELKTTLYSIILDGHTTNTYTSLWQHFQKTDKMSNDQVWDMYSDCGFEFVTDQCGNYSSQCDCYNREHSFPASWMGGDNQYPMYADLHHIVPTDGYANNKRSSFPFGRVGTATWTSLNGSKLGPSIAPGYSGTVFEPIDEFKGDFARIMFYMVTRYENVVTSWPSNDANAAAVLDGSAWPAFKQWTKELYLFWHENDPVSQKEIARNDSIYLIQHNRNPFIDHPEYARQIWGPDANVQTEETILFSIYPQPADHEIFITASQLYHWGNVYDISGRTITTFEYTQSPFKLDISGLQPGIYLIRLYSESSIATEYLIKN